MTREKLSRLEMIENALREIASNAPLRGGDWASEQALSMLEFLDLSQEARRTPQKN